MGNILEGSSYILNPIANVNGYLTTSDEIYDFELKKSQAEINVMAQLSSSIDKIVEYYAVYDSPKYSGTAEEMKLDPNINWIVIPNDEGIEFPLMTPEKPYLWNYESFKQTNGEDIQTEPKVIGVLGRGIKTIKKSYTITRDPSPEPDINSSDWKNYSPATTDEFKYLWEKQEVFYSDNYEEATPDKIFITLVGVKGEAGIDGTQIEYIFCFSKSRGTIPPKPDSTDDPNYQNPDFIPYPRLADFEAGKEDYYWADEPVGVSEKYPAQWISKREFIYSNEGNHGDGSWSEFSEPKLYSTHGEDGVSIESIETWYLISDTNIFSDKIGSAAEKAETEEDEKKAYIWYKNSPAVNKDYKYLWKKTITSYSAAIIDNPDTESDESKIKKSTSYEVIGSLGDPGIDGDSVEWIYTRTITNEKPAIFTSINDSGASDIFTEEDFLGDDPTNNDYIPHPTSDDFSKGKTNYYWSDDIQGVNDKYIYGWRAQRKKTRNDDGTQTWKNFSEPTQIMYQPQDGLDAISTYKSIVFCRYNSIPNKPIPDKITVNGVEYNSYENPIPPVGEDKVIWYDGIPDGTAAIWSSFRIFSSTGESPQSLEWSEPKVMTDTPDVEIVYSAWDAYIDLNDYTSLIFIKDEDGKIDSGWLAFANQCGWYDEPDQCYTSDKKKESPVWMAISRKTGGKWSKWEISKIKGERGADGTSINVEGHYETYSDFEKVWVYWKWEQTDSDGNPIIDPETGAPVIKIEWKHPNQVINPNTGEPYTNDSCFVVEGNLWVWDGSDEWVNVGKFRGDPGISSFLHVRYANVYIPGETKENSIVELTDNGGTVPGKYITTFTNQLSNVNLIVGGVPDPEKNEVDARFLEWKKWLGEDGYGYEYIYKLTSELVAPKLPTDSSETENDYVPEGWSDDPLSVSKEFPYCWQAYRIRTDNKWGEWMGNSEKTEAVLWAKFGKDGRSLGEVTYWYCISDSDNKEEIAGYNTYYKEDSPEEDTTITTPAPGITTPAPDITTTITTSKLNEPKVWYPNSPAVNDNYKYLWKKTINTYLDTDLITNDYLPETQTIYELIGIKGSNGVDGSDIEWAYKLTRGNNCPTSENDKYWPTDEEVTGTTAGGWTDDPLDVSEEWQYQWVIKRTKPAGEDKWGDWGTKIEPVGTVPYFKASLNNTFGNHVKTICTYYIASNETELENLTPDNSLNLSDYKKKLDELKWSTTGNDITLSQTLNKLFEITLFEFTDGTYTVNGPTAKGIWSGANPNLLKNTNFDVLNNDGTQTQWENLENTGSIIEGDYQGFNVYEHTLESKGIYCEIPFTINKGDTFTLSCMVKNEPINFEPSTNLNTVSGLQLYIPYANLKLSYDEGNIDINGWRDRTDIYFKYTPEWTKKVLTFTYDPQEGSDESISNVKLYTYRWHGTSKIAQLKLEEGELATSYIKHVEDLKGETILANPNLLKNTNFDLYKSDGKTQRDWKIFKGTRVEDGYQGFNSFYSDSSTNVLRQRIPVTFRNGEVYTLSCIAKNNNIVNEWGYGSGFILWVPNLSSSNIKTINKEEITNRGWMDETKTNARIHWTFDNNTSWTKRSVTFKYEGEDYSTADIAIYVWQVDTTPSPDDITTPSPENKVSVEIAQLKLESGYKATSYQKNLDDYGMSFKSTVFKRDTSTPDTPTGGSYDSPVPEGWSDGVPSGNGDIYSSTCTFYYKEGTSGWSAPQKMVDSVGFEVMYSSNSTAPTIPERFDNSDKWWTSANTNGWFDNETEVTNPKWMATNSLVNGAWGKWTVTQILGEKGDPGDPGKDGNDGLSPQENLLLNSGFDKELSYADKEKKQVWYPWDNSTSWKIVPNKYQNMNAISVGGSSITYDGTFDSAGTYVFSVIVYQETVLAPIGIYVSTACESSYQAIQGNVSHSANDTFDIHEITTQTLKEYVQLSIKLIINKAGNFRISLKGSFLNDNYYVKPKLELSDKPTPYRKAEGDLTGPSGKAGTAMYPLGDWMSDVLYERTIESAPFVYYDANTSDDVEGTYYMLKVGSSSGQIPPENPSVWEKITGQSAIYTKFLMADFALFGSKRGGVFYDRYLFSQVGINADNEEVYFSKYRDNMFTKKDTDTDPQYVLNGSFIPNMFIDFLSGALKVTRFSEPFIVATEPVVKVNYEKNHNILIKHDIVEGQLGITDSNKFEWRNHLVLLPEYDETQWIEDGQHFSILMEHGGTMYGQAWPIYNTETPGISWKNIYTVVGVDDKLLKSNFSNSGYSSGEYEGNWFIWKGMRTKFVLLTPGIILKLRLYRNTSVVSGKNVTVNYWHIENSMEFSIMDACVRIVEGDLSNGFVTTSNKVSCKISSDPYYFQSIDGVARNLSTDQNGFIPFVLAPSNTLGINHSEQDDGIVIHIDSAKNGSDCSRAVRANDEFNT